MFLRTSSLARTKSNHLQKVSITDRQTTTMEWYPPSDSFIAYTSRYPITSLLPFEYQKSDKSLVARNHIPNNSSRKCEGKCSQFISVIFHHRPCWSWNPTLEMKSTIRPYIPAYVQTWTSAMELRPQEPWF